MRLQFGALGVTMSWDDGFPGARASRPHDDGFLGARASRPHQAWHSLGHLLHLDQPGTAPWLSFGLADGVPAHRAAACSIALKLSAGQRNKYAGGTPALPGDTVPAVPCGSFEEKRPIVNEDEPRMDTNRPEDRWTSFNDKRHQHASATCALGVTMSWDDGFPGARASRPHDDGFLGARASRPHKAWHSLGHLPHLDQPATAPWLSFGLAAAVPAHMAACSIALKLSGGQRDSMRARRPRSQAMPSRRCRADHSRKNGRSLMKTNHEWTRMDTNRPEDRWTSFNDKRHQHASATCALGVTMSWDDGFLGARASRPH